MISIEHKYEIEKKKKLKRKHIESKECKFLCSHSVLCYSFVQVSDNCSRLHCVLYFHRRLKLVLLFDKCALTSILTFPDEILTNRRWRDVSVLCSVWKSMRHNQNACPISLYIFLFTSFVLLQEATGDLLFGTSFSDFYLYIM